MGIVNRINRNRCQNLEAPIEMRGLDLQPSPVRAVRKRHLAQRFAVPRPDRFDHAERRAVFDASIGKAPIEVGDAESGQARLQCIQIDRAGAFCDAFSDHSAGCRVKGPSPLIASLAEDFDFVPTGALDAAHDDLHGPSTLGKTIVVPEVREYEGFVESQVLQGDGTIPSHDTRSG